jgi:putative transposase
MKNQILLENYCPPSELEARPGAFVEYHNRVLYHESLDNLTPADVCFGRGQAILEHRARLKQKTTALRCELHRQLTAGHSTTLDQSLS